jgi:hypothetical protein
MSEATYTVGFRKPPRKVKGQLNTRHARCKTGCVGVCFSTVHEPRAGGKKARRFFSVYAGGKNRRFCIETLGFREAFRRAVELRARFETAVTAHKAALQKARAGNPRQVTGPLTTQNPKRSA